MYRITLVLVLLVGCATSFTTRGKGADASQDLLVYDSHRTNHAWGLFKQKIDPKLCPSGDALIEETAAPFYRYTVIGLLYYRTHVRMWCRNEEYRAMVKQQRDEYERKFAEWEAAYPEEAARLREENARRAQEEQEKIWRDMDANTARWNAELAQSRDEQTARIQQMQAGWQGYSPPQPAEPAREPAYQPAPTYEPARDPSHHSRSSSETTVTVSERRVSTAKAQASNHEQCDAVLPDVIDQGVNNQAVTRLRRAPCHKCIDSGKVFSIYDLKPLTSSCD